MVWVGRDKWFSIIRGALHLYRAVSRGSTGYHGTSRPYHYVRFRWMKPLNLDAALAELSRSFEVAKKVRPRDEVELTLYGDQRDEVTAKADTLVAVMSPYRAVLFQRERRPFTVKDMALRTWVFEMYDKTTPTPFPWGGDSEPKYEVEEEKK